MITLEDAHNEHLHWVIKKYVEVENGHRLKDMFMELAGVGVIPGTPTGQHLLAAAVEVLVDKGDLIEIRYTTPQAANILEVERSSFSPPKVERILLPKGTSVSETPPG
jgi:hypothetical protein